MTAAESDRTVVEGLRVLEDADDRAFFSHDICSRGILPLCAVRPGRVEQLAESVKRATDAGFAVIARGGGSSCTGGYLPTSERSMN